MKQEALTIHWTDEHLSQLGDVQHFEDVAEITISAIKKTRESFHGLSIPMTTGGYGKEINLEIAKKCIILANSRNIKIFNILPIERGIYSLKTKWEDAGNLGYCKPIIEITYRIIFESGVFEKIRYSPNWRSSEGCKGERKIFKELGIELIKIPDYIWTKVLSDLKL